MKAALLVESLTGNTWKAAEKVAGLLSQERWSITGLDPMRAPDHGAIQGADVVLLGTWVHGFFAVFCTFALNPGRSLDTLTSAARTLGADVIGGVALSRGKLDEHTEVLAQRLVSATSATPNVS